LVQYHYTDLFGFPLLRSLYFITDSFLPKKLSPQTLVPLCDNETHFGKQGNKVSRPKAFPATNFVLPEAVVHFIRMETPHTHFHVLTKFTPWNSRGLLAKLVVSPVPFSLFSGTRRFKTVLARVHHYSLASDGPISTSSDPIYILAYIELPHFMSKALSVIPVRQVFLPKIHWPFVRCVLHASTVASCFDLILIIYNEESKLFSPLVYLRPPHSFSSFHLELLHLVLLRVLHKNTNVFTIRTDVSLL